MAKRDYTNPPAKLKLRRHFIDRYHSGDEPANVFDAVAGDGGLWKELRKLPAVANYWGVDSAPKTGRLKVDAVRVLSQPGWRYNVVDIDTAGQPWKHWLALLPNVSRPTTVFMTLGRPHAGRPLSDIEREALGLEFPSLKLPAGFTKAVIGRSLYPLLKRAEAFQLRLVETQIVRPPGGGTFVGVHLYPLGVPRTAEPVKKLTRKKPGKISGSS